ncbi:MAG: sensor histidine kinase [Streptosporangiaceae bacterium]
MGKVAWRLGRLDDGPSLFWRLVGVSMGLSYLFIPGLLIDPAHSGLPTALAEGVVVGFAALFLATAASMFDSRGRTSPLSRTLLGALTAVGFGMPIAFGAAWAGLLMYMGIAYAMTLPHTWRVVGLGTATAAVVGIGLASAQDNGWIFFMGFQTCVVGLLMLAFRNSRELVLQLREARGEVARLAANEERLRIARDLHDVLGHSLSLMALKSELAGELAERDGAHEAAREIGDVEAASRQALLEVREAVAGYRQRGLADELDSARAMLSAAGVETTVRTCGTPLPDQLDGLFGWAVREGATNVVRHSGARHVTIVVERGDSGASLEMSDDGTGWLAGPGGGSGLAGLSERVHDAGGQVRAATRPDGGFRLVVRLPIGEQTAGGDELMARVSA